MKITDPKVRGIIEAYFQQSLDDEALSNFNTRTLPGGDWLFHQGDAGDSLYFMVRGRLQVWVNTSSADEPMLVGEVAPGESVGEVALLSDEPRSAGIRAIRDSLLIQLDRKAFTRLAESHPAMVMKLATNVANLLQRRTGGKKSASRNVKTVCLLPITAGSAVNEYCSALVQALSRHKRTLDLSPASLQALGAPRTEDIDQGNRPDQPLPDALAHWLSDQEDQYDLVVYRCGLQDSAWTRFALRQSDIILEVAEASSERAEHRAAPSANTKDSTTATRSLILLQESKETIQNTLHWLEQGQYQFHLHMVRGSADDVERAARVLTGKAVGLVLGGGAARGIAALGAFKALHEGGVPVDWVGGTSIGSIMAAQISRGWSPEEAIAKSRIAFYEGKPFSDFTIPVISLLRGKKMKRLLNQYLDFQIEDAALPYYCVSTNLGRGVKNIHTRGSMVDAICASAALPGVIPPAIVNSELTVDGALLDNLPVDIMQQNPVGKIIAVDVSSRVNKKVSFDEVPSPWAILRGRWLPFSRRYSLPSLTTLMLKATEIGTLEHSRRHGEMADLLIDPPVRQFGMMDTKSFELIVQAGYDRTRELLQDWKG